MLHRGFFTPTMIAAAVAAAAIVVLGISLKVQSARLAGEKEAHAATKAEFGGFKAEVKRAGEKAKADADAERKRQKRVNRDTVTSYEKRLASLNATYRSLRDQRADSNRNPVPPVPDTARPTDETARDQRLLDLLQHADRQTAQLIELQEWVRAQGQK